MEPDKVHKHMLAIIRNWLTDTIPRRRKLNMLVGVLGYKAREVISKINKAEIVLLNKRPKKGTVGRLR